MKKRIFAGITVLAIGTIFAGQLVWARTTPTVEDGTQLQNFLLQKHSTDASEKDYDLNGDGTWNVLDLCLLKRQLQKQNHDEITFGTQTNDDFLVDNVLHSDTQGEIHFSSYIPNSYDGSEPYALFVTLPGWEGLYFQGVGANMVEGFPHEAKKYNDKMIILSPQLNDWGETSDNMTIAENDTYYGSGYLKDAYQQLHDLYLKQGLTESEIREILVLDVRPDSYFTEQGYRDQHSGGNAFSADESVMGWLFGKVKQ